MKKRILSILLTLCMVLMLVPATAFAETPSERYSMTLNFKYGTLYGETGSYDLGSDYKAGDKYDISGELYDLTGYKPYKIVDCRSAEGDGVKGFITDHDIVLEVLYEVDGSLAITVDVFEVGNTPADCTYSVESTIPGVTFSEDDIQPVFWSIYVFNEARERYEWLLMDETEIEVFQAGTQHKLWICLDNKGLDRAPAVTVNGKTPEDCLIATRDGVPIQLQIDCELGTPAEPPAPSLVIGDIDLDGEVTVKDATMLQDCLENPESFEKFTFEQWMAADFNGDGVVTESDLTALRSFLNPITIDGPDVVCAQQDYEFTVTPADGVTLEDWFWYENDDADGYAEQLTIDEDGVGHGVVPASEYGDADRMKLTVSGAAADGTPVFGTKGVQILKEHRFVDGVCGCGAVQQYTVEYIGSGDDPICMDTKTHGEPLTLRGETFKMDGFVQTGWVDKETGAVYRLGDTYTENADVTLNPVFEKIITLTVPYTTTVALGDVGVPGEKTFTLALIGGSAPDKDKSNVTITGSVTTNGKGSYNGTLTITGTERTLWVMLSEGAFVQQVDAGEDGWTVDDTVWGVLMEEIPVAYAMGDDAIASGYTAYVVPASIDGNGYYYIDRENLQAADMAFTNTYTAHDYALKHDATHHWDECACKDVQNKELHKYGDWTVTKEATEQEAGEKEHTCTVCGYTEKAEIEKLPATTEPTKPGTDTKPDTKPGKDNPATGDNSHMALWFALLLVSGAGVIGTTVYGRKKRAK